MKIKRCVKLLGLKFKTEWKNLVEYLKVIKRYYKNRDFRRVDTYLLRHYILQNPYEISKKFLEERGDRNIYTYGETPLTTVERITEKCCLGEKDFFYELGSGRGRTCFWVRCFKKCRVVGIEFVPEFVKYARETAKRYQLEGIRFIYQDMLEVDFSPATAIYFYGSIAETSFIMQLIEKFKTLRAGTKIITVSYPLTHYTVEPLFDLIEVFSAEFTWGNADVYLHVRK